MAARGVASNSPFCYTEGMDELLPAAAPDPVPEQSKRERMEQAKEEFELLTKRRQELLEREPLLELQVRVQLLERRVHTGPEERLHGLRLLRLELVYVSVLESQRALLERAQAGRAPGHAVPEPTGSSLAGIRSCRLFARGRGLVHGERPVRSRRALWRGRTIHIIEPELGHRPCLRVRALIAMQRAGR